MYYLLNYIINQLQYITFLFYNTKISDNNALNACSVSTLNGKGNPLKKEFL
jgi:hypothetical protein